MVARLRCSAVGPARCTVDAPRPRRRARLASLFPSALDRAARHLDREKVGQLLYPSRAYGWMPEGELLRRYGNDRDWFNVERAGSSNVGHDVWWRIRTNENRRALIEYLKTL